MLGIPGSKHKIDYEVRCQEFVLLVSFGAILADAQSFQHIVLIVQENRTPDNLFQGLCGPGRKLCPVPYNLQNFGINQAGQKDSLGPNPVGDQVMTGIILTLGSLDSAIWTQTNTCRMDGLTTTGCPLSMSVFLCQPSRCRPIPHHRAAVRMGELHVPDQPRAHHGCPSIYFRGNFCGHSRRRCAGNVCLRIIRPMVDGGCLAPLGEIYWLISPQSWPEEYQCGKQSSGNLLFLTSPRWQRCSTITSLLSVGSITRLARMRSRRRRIGSVKSACRITITSSAPDRSGRIMSISYPQDVLSDIGACKLPNMIWVIPRRTEFRPPRRSQFYRWSFLGSFDCQRHWGKFVQESRRQQLLEQHGHLRYVGRLGRLV